MPPTDEIVNSAFAIIANSLKEGAKMGGVDIILDGTVATLENSLGEKYPNELRTPAGRAGVKAFLPFVILCVLKTFPRGTFPNEALIAELCRVAIMGTSQKTFKALTPLLMPLMRRFAVLAAKSGIRALEGESPQIEEDVDVQSVQSDDDLDD